MFAGAVAAFAFLNSSVLPIIIVLAALLFASVTPTFTLLLFAFVTPVLVFVSVVAGVDSTGVSATVSSTEMLPVSAGIAKSSADSIKVVAAAIVIFDKIVCEPRGWNAVLEILLVKSAPASVLPGWSKTLAISATQETKNNVYKR